MFSTLKLDVADGVAVVTLSRPDARNAMSARLMTEMVDCAGQLAERRDVDVILVTGHPPCFSAGADLKDGTRWGDPSQTLDEQRDTARLGFRMARAWEELPQITVAAIEGYAIGGGLALSVALDWRVIASDAFVSLPEIALGIPLTWGTIPRLVNLVGPSRAKRLTILGERLPAADALAMGLVDYVVPPGQAVAKARDIAGQVLALPRHSVRMSKETVNVYASIGAQAAGHMAHDQILLAAGSPEAKAARERFAKKKGK